jgi:hypothetical protein
VSADGLAGVELYNKRFDWLVASLAGIPLIWLFYGFDAAFVCLLAFALIGALKPLARQLGSQLAAGIFSAGLILAFSPLLRVVFYNGYCYDGVWSVASGVSRYQAPGICERGFFDHFGQQLWAGPLRDLAMPLLGLGLIMIVWPPIIKRSDHTDCEPESDESGRNGAPIRSVRRWLVLALSVLAWVAGTHINYRAQQAEIEKQLLANMAERARQAEEARKEAQRVAAEEAAKRVDRTFLVGLWAPMHDGSSDPDFYCGTDAGYIFRDDGTYAGFGEGGRFRLQDSKAFLTDRSSWDMDEADGNAHPLEPKILLLERRGKQLAIDGEVHGPC